MGGPASPLLWLQCACPLALCERGSSGHSGPVAACTSQEDEEACTQAGPRAEPPPVSLLACARGPLRPLLCGLLCHWGSGAPGTVSHMLKAEKRCACPSHTGEEHSGLPCFRALLGVGGTWWGCAVSGDSVRGLVTREDLDTVEEAASEGPAGVRLGAPVSVRAVRAGVEASRAVGVGGTGAQGKALVGQGQSSAQKCPARGGHPREPGHRECPRWLTGDVAEPLGRTWPVMDDHRDTSLRWGWGVVSGLCRGKRACPQDWGGGARSVGLSPALLDCGGCVSLCVDVCRRLLAE